MTDTLIPFTGNCTTNIGRQAKYRLVHQGGHYAIEVTVETPDGIRTYPSSREHPRLVEMINRIKLACTGTEGGQFYLNEWRQLIVPTGQETQYYYGGEYDEEIILSIDGEEFCGRPFGEDGNLLKPGSTWTGRPRPGIAYKLKAGGRDIEYTVALGPGRERVVRLSAQVGALAAARTAGKIAAIKGNSGGTFYINECRTLFAPVHQNDYQYVFIGTLNDTDPWFAKWTPGGDAGPARQQAHEGLCIAPPPAEQRRPPQRETPAQPSTTGGDFTPAPKMLRISEDETGHSMESLFAPYLRGSTLVRLEDPYMKYHRQAQNLLRFCEMLVKLGSVKRLKLVTRETSDETTPRLESLRQSLISYGVTLDIQISQTLHDRQVTSDNGWAITLGRGLDMFKRPESTVGIGGMDLSLRQCYETTLGYHQHAEGLQSII